MVGRDTTQASMAKNKLKKFEAHKRLIDAHEEPEKLPAVSATFGIMKAIDLVPSHLRERLGLRKVSLAYVIRDLATPPVIPLQAANSITSDAFSTIMDELIAFTPHTDEENAEDNVKVLQNSPRYGSGYFS